MPAGYPAPGRARALYAPRVNTPFSEPPDLVVFDCDGVLVDSERIAVTIDVRMLADLGWPLTQEEVVERFVGRSFADMGADIAAHLGRPLPDGWDAPYRQLYRDAFEADLTPVDGVVESPNLWQFDAFDDELGALLGETMSKIDTVLLGRVGFEEWAGYWPNAEADQDFAQFINNMPKYVASRTRSQADLSIWQNSTLIEGDVVEFARELKAREGGEIAVMGGQGAVNILYRNELKDAEAAGRDVAEVRTQLANEYTYNVASPFLAAERGEIDGIIEPAATRLVIIKALRALRTKRAALPAKKHGNIPL